MLGPLAAPAGAERPIARQAAVEHALAHAESAAMIRHGADAARARAMGVSAFTRPRLDLTARYLDLETNAEQNPFFGMPEREYAAELTAAWLVFAGGRIQSGRLLTENGLALADLAAAAGFRDIRHAARMAFDAVLYQRASLAILADRVAQRETELADAGDLWNVGMVTRLDTRQAQLNLNFAVAELAAGRAALEEAIIEFNKTLGRDGASPDRFAPEGDLAAPNEPEETIGRLAAALPREDLLDLRVSRLERHAARLSLEMAEGEGRPSLSLVSSAATSGEDVDEMSEDWAVGLRLDWNVFDGGLIRSRRAEAEAELRRADAALARARKTIDAQVVSIITRLRSLAERIRLRRESATLAAENYDDARGQYRAGTITLTHLGEFNLSQAEARFNLLRLFFLMRQELNRAEALLEEPPPARSEG